MNATRRIPVIDSHTGGEPTRVVVAGGPDLGAGSMAERLARFRDNHDEFRSAVVNEPRGSDVMVGALLCEPLDPACAAGVIFFNNVGYLGMCGHGTIGLVVTLAHMGRIGAGAHRIETPVGTVTAILHESGEVTVENVPSYRSAAAVEVDVGGRRISGDVAWGGNWFFLVADHGERIELSNVERLTEFAWRVRRALERDGVAGDTGAIDHIELFGPPSSGAADSKNFVLCPGGAYDRSPCGTGASAKLACLAADGKLAEGATWRQESIAGSIFHASYRRAGDRIVPSIRGSAWVDAEATLILDPRDPFRHGIRK
jgi:4-hydroxyproline epimerase